MQFALNEGALCGPTFCPLGGPHWKLSIALLKSRDAVASALRGWTLQGRMSGAGISPEPHKPCHFRQLQWFYNAVHMPHKPCRPLQGVRWEFWQSLLFDVPSVERWIQTVSGFMMSDKCSLPTRSHIRHSMKQFLVLLWLYPATTTYSRYWCLLDPSIRKVVWTLMSRRILGLTRFSTGLPRRLGLTHTKLEESTSCIPSWHWQSRLLGCDGLTTYRNFRAQGLSDTTWVPLMHGTKLPRPSERNSSLHVTTWCRFLNVVVW